ncbi:uncharacterized protein LOC108321508 [Vigna angularis]|uniref:uncharacterized protein LOC108321508 n=1 Tax=Phaseolus angularis TaxID=3914 RepID=UPI0022B56701|nr:uncharacterized protein LOC108321508 [Vigna angularis]
MTTSQPSTIDLLIEQVSRLTARIDDLSSEVASIKQKPLTQSSFPKQTPKIRLDCPRFDGSNTLDWIFAVTRFFDYHQTPEVDRLQIISFYMDGPALSWFQWMERNQFLRSWKDFLHSLETRFAPSRFQNVKGRLCKLYQTRSVLQYLNDFEGLANRVTDVPPSFLLECFISGLHPDIQREVLAFQPVSFSEAAELAKLQEDKFNSIEQPQRSSTVPVARSLPTTPRQALLPTPLTPTVPFKRLSASEMQNRRERGLCYNCDEKYNPGHRCKSRFFLLVHDDEETISSDLPPDDSTASTIPDSAQLSLNALSGHFNSKMFCVTGQILEHSVCILIDSGSSHNFLQSKRAHELGLPFQPTKPLSVMVGNGHALTCSQVCTQVPLLIQNQAFMVDFHLIDLCGPEAVLGVQWLQSLGPVLTDYEHLTMQFTWSGQMAKLIGDVNNDSLPLSVHHLRKLYKWGHIAECFHLTVLPPPVSNSATYFCVIPTDNHELSTLLNRFQSLFEEPSSLPPERPTDHAITLLPNSAPVKVRPYRYPYSQKQEIEAQVARMLVSGEIQPSTSAFSSPVLLVKKKDNTWRCCVDYRALNAITVPNSFPIPTIDELLDELGSAIWFSKLDLLQGYHQIRMKLDDIHKTAFRTHDGHFEFRVLPFGLWNAPATFQATMNALFRLHLRKFIIVFFMTYRYSCRGRSNLMCN